MMTNLDGRLYRPGQALAISGASSMFQVTASEFADWKSQIVTSNFGARRTWLERWKRCISWTGYETRKREGEPVEVVSVVLFAESQSATLNPVWARTASAGI
jgi:hypothetical protein